MKKTNIRIPLIVVMALATSVQAAPATDANRAGWMREAVYGVCVHYLADGEVSVMRADDIHADGVARNWNACVDAFDVERFADEMKRAGAGYVMFTILQGSRFVAAPNAVYDEWFGFRPGEACSRRDLPMELADALARRGIPLMLYFTGDGPIRDSGCVVRSGFQMPIPMEWVEKWAKVLECFAVRYGRKVKGWWIDGCYVRNGNYGYTPEKLRLYERAIRKGNPDALVSFNRAEDIAKEVVDPYVPFQDFTAGEKYDFGCLPPSGGVVDGQQWHILTHLGTWWGRPGVRYSTATIAEYLHLVSRAGGVVTLDVMCYWDGGLERSQIDTLAGVRPALARLKGGKEPSSALGNLAFLRPVRCLSLGGDLLPVHIEMRRHGGGRDMSLAATDGDSATFVRGCREWPWQLEVDLGSQREFRRVHARYCRGNYATRVRLSVSQNGREWQTVTEIDNDNPAETVFEFPSVRARYLRFAAIKPDGEGQPGVQMAITEIDVR